MKEAHEMIPLHTLSLVNKLEDIVLNYKNYKHKVIPKELGNIIVFTAHEQLSGYYMMLYNDDYKSSNVSRVLKMGGIYHLNTSVYDDQRYPSDEVVNIDISTVRCTEEDAFMLSTIYEAPQVQMMLFFGELLHRNVPKVYMCSEILKYYKEIISSE